MNKGSYYWLYSTGVPGPPVNVRISHYTPDSVTLQWDPPEYNGGSSVTKYNIQMNEWDISRGTHRGTGETSEMSFTIGQLSESYEYTFGIRAINKIGYSKVVETSERVRPQQQAGKLS